MRIGLGTMGLAHAQGPPRADALRVIAAALDAGIDHLDTADVYAPTAQAIGYAERLVAEAARGRATIATKGGVVREGERWTHDGRPAHLRAACDASRRRLGVDAIDLYYLHAVDARVPIEESVGALARLRDEGAIGGVGVSNVTLEELERAAAVTTIDAVQNPAGVANPRWREDGVLAWCEARGVPFVAHSPMGSWRAGRTAHVPALRALAVERGVTPFDVVLGWLLGASEVTRPIPGATRPATARASAAAAALRLTPEEIARLEAALVPEEAP